jgi:uncharacterized membrane protein required for colicin V production
MFDLILLLILVAGFFVGLRRGLILQIVHLTGFIAAYIIAYLYYGDLAPKLKLWIPYPNFGGDGAMSLLIKNANIEDVFYRAIAFIILFIAVKIVMQIIGSMLDFLAHFPILKQVNSWVGGLFGFVEVYLIIFLLLYIAALVPNSMVQTTIQHSFVANIMVKHTPVFSDAINHLWIENTPSKNFSL